MLDHYLNEILQLEFSERNLEIPELVTRKMEEMNARGILHSGITLQNISEFFIGEFLARNDFIRDFIISNADIIEPKPDNDIITTAKMLFQESSYSLKESLVELYFSSVKKITESLQNKSMIGQLETNFHTKMENRIRKNNLYIEIAFQKEKLSKKTPKDILSIRPSIHGISIDLNELWNKMTKT